MKNKNSRAADHNNVMAAISEHDEQVVVVEYLYRQYPKALFWATPNGARLSGGPSKRARQMNALKAEGFLPGVADLIIFEPRGGFSCMMLEMKRSHGGVVSDNQFDFLAQAEARGAFTAVCHGASEAIQLIDEYMNYETKTTNRRRARASV